MNPHLNRINVLRTALENEKVEFDAATTDVANWERAAAVDRANNASAGTLANTAKQLDRAKARLGRSKERMDSLNAELAREGEARDRWDSAYADATAKGLTGAAAEEYAKASTERAQLINNIIKWVAITLGILAVGYGIAVFIRWKRKSK